MVLSNQLYLILSLLGIVNYNQLVISSVSSFASLFQLYETVRNSVDITVQRSVLYSCM